MAARVLGLIASVGAVVAMVASVASGVAAARPARPAAEAPWRKGVSKAQMQAAGRLLKKATALWVNKEVKKALAAYREALAQWDHPSIWLNIAECLVQLDRPLKAYRAVVKALRYGQGPHTAAHYQQALNYRKLLRGRLARLTVRCAEPGAKVTVNGKEWVTGPGARSKLVLPGEMQIVATKAKYVTKTRKVLVMPGKSVKVTLSLVRVKQLVRELVSKTKVVWKRRWKRWMPWVVFGTGLAVAAVGVPLMVMSQLDIGKFDDYVDAKCSEGGCAVSGIPQDILDRRSSGKRWGAAAITMFSLGGAVVAAGVTLLVLNRAKAEQVEEPGVPRKGPGTGPAPGPVTGPRASGPRDFRVVPTLLPGGAAVSAGFSF